MSQPTPSDLDSFKLEMRALVMKMDEKLTLIEKGDWLANKITVQDLRSSIAVSDKVFSISTVSYIVKTDQ